jgi:hypothetical protein
MSREVAMDELLILGTKADEKDKQTQRTDKRKKLMIAQCRGWQHK